MTEDFTSEALLYLLDDLDPGRRAAFEERLARDPVAAAAFKHCADTYAQFALEAAPASPVSDAERRASLAAILAQTSRIENRSARVDRRGAPTLRWFWPVAAAMLLGLNVLQFLRFVPGSDGGSGALPATKAGGAIAGASNVTASESGSAVPDWRDQVGPSVKGDTSTPGGVRAGAMTAEIARLEALQREYVGLRKAKDTLDSQYDKAMRNLAQRALAEQGVGRLATMELVDASSYERGERKGLMNLARRLLTEPGIITPDPTPSGTANTPGAQSRLVELGSNTGLASAGQNPTDNVLVAGTAEGTTAISVAGVGTVSSFSSAAPGADDSIVVVNGPAGNTAPPEETPRAPAAPVPQVADTPYAWSVYDEKENQGYLNLYNIPAVTPNQALQVWVKPLGSSDYRLVGEVPAQFYGKSGAVSYVLPAGTATPSEVLITLEPRGPQPPQKPTGSVMLRGP
jgi:anti-sigma-K factor RskA